MAFDPFRVDLDGVLELSRHHADAVASLKASMGSAAAAGAEVDRVHGSIGSRVTGAFGAVLEARHEALQAAAHTGGELSQRLGQAVLAYTRGDESGAESVRAAAEAMTGGPTGTGSSGTPTASGAHIAGGALGAAESGGVADALARPGQDTSHLAQSAGKTEAAAGVSAGIGAVADLPVAAPAPPERPDDEQAEKLTRD